MPAGTNPGLSIVANSSAPTINYQWYRNTTASTVGATPVSSGSASLTGQTALTSGTYYYYCVATAVCGANPTAQSQFFTVTVTLDPSTLPAGVGSLAGRTCFDVAQNTCENLPANVRSQTNFALRTPQTTASTAPYSGVQTYTFTSRAANVSNVRYELVRTAGNLTASQLIDPATPLSGTLQPGALANGSSVNLEIKYMNNLNTALAGTSRGDGAKITLYIIYFNGTQDVQIKTVISIQDCACCGAFTAAGVFKVFMCHNLGANESLDPFLTGQAGLHGAKYKWGTGVVALPMAQDQSTPGGISGWGSIGGTPPNTALDWDMNTANPCPVGYRVPTEAEFAGMISNNTWTAKLAPGGSWTAGNSNYSSGKMVGSALFLPAAGVRAYTNGALSGRGNKGFYWTASPASTVLSARLEFSNTVAENVTGGNSRNKSFGMSIRCIEQ